MMSQILLSDNMWRAWEHVRSKHGGPGLDHERVEDIEPCVEGVLAEIGDLTAQGAYRPGSLLSFEKQKSSGGIRELTIANMRDRILSRAVSQILIARFNGVLLPQCYAYRPHRGALKAVSAIQKGCREATFAVRADIESFFDTIDHDRLREHLAHTGVPVDVMDLIMSFVQATHFDGSTSRRPSSGVPQGSPLSPMLANLYLNGFDHALEQSHPRFVRYADDLVLLTDEIEDAHRGLNRIEELVDEDHLKLSLAKTRIMRIDKGFLFLGFVFNRQGHSASKEARERLRLKLEDGAKADEFPDETQKRMQSISRGWKNYYGEGKEAGNGEASPAISKSASEPNPIQEPSSVTGAELMTELRRKLASGELDPEDPVYARSLHELAAYYEAAGLFAAASACRTEAGGPAESETIKATPLSADVEASVDRWWPFLHSMDEPLKRGKVDRLGRVGYRALSSSPDKEDLIKHLKGEWTLAVPIHHRKDLVRFGVIDLDISRKVVDGLGVKARMDRVEALKIDAMGFAQRAEEMGIPSVVEISGYKGAHVWFFAQNPMPVADMHYFLQTLVRISGEPPEGCHRELFPASSQYLPDEAATDSEMQLQIAKDMVAAKLFTAGQSLRRWHRNRWGSLCKETWLQVEELAEGVAGCRSHGHLRAIEGQAAQRYFQALGESLPSAFGWSGRNRQPPRDPVNAMLSLSYMLMLGRIIAVCHAVGLDPQVGFLHQLEYGRPSLALDILEPLRSPCCDHFVLRQLQSEDWEPADFRFDLETGCRMQPDAMHRFLNAFQAYNDPGVRSSPAHRIEDLARELRGAFRERRSLQWIKTLGDAA